VDYWRVRGPQMDRGMLNYGSVGGDAAVALDFHHTRQRFPRLVRGQMINKGLYALLGAGQRHITLANCVRVAGSALPAWTHALVWSNITSYAGGVRLVRTGRADDGFCDVVALGSGVPLGLATGGVRRPRLLARRAHLHVTLNQSLPMQIDGEPFIATPGSYSVSVGGQVRLLVAPTFSDTTVPRA
jgi:diacylglycerol kinase (ATP)